jgi:Mg-chelatase subunit ChlD
MRARKCVLAAVAMSLVFVSPVLADTRKENIDVIIALDKSLSMEVKVDAVKTWVNSFIIDQLLIPGDLLNVVAFYGKADVIISQTIRDDADKKAAKAIISGIRGNGRFTDIGNALDVVKAQLADKEKDGREKYVLLLTDGIQEAPPTSKYYSKGGTFNHEFLANTKTIQQKGWKVMILGIGTDTAAKDLAKELQGSYSEITKTLTPESITQKAGTLFGMPSIDGPVNVDPIPVNGASRVTFNLKPTGLAGDMRITVSGLSAQAGSRTVPGLLPGPVTIVVRKEGTTSVSLPVLVPPVLQPGTTAGTLTFAFGSTERFSPAQAPVSLRVMGWVQSNVLFLAVVLALLLLVAAAIAYLVWRLTRGRPMRFGILVDESPLEGGVISLRAGKDLFLNETSSVFSTAPRRTGKSIARFSVKDGRLVLGVLKQDRFPKLKEVPPDARGKSFILRSESGKTLTLKVQSKERKK